MQIDNALILRIETLARLELTASEREMLTKDLNKILAMVEKMEELDTSNVEPLVYIHDAANVLRADEIGNQVSQEAALANAPDSEGQYFKVPKVL